jgi:23S rRNA pseudouridine2605 synthase
VKELIRLNKFISNSGLCSRREADMYISMGEVKVNDKIINQLGYKIRSGDKVYFNGQEITGQKNIYIILNKPKGYLATTNENNKNRLCTDLISIKNSSKLKTLFSLGRSNLGLVFFSNDLQLIEKLKKKPFKIKIIYQVNLNKEISSIDMVKIKKYILGKISKKIMVRKIDYVANKPKNIIGIETFLIHGNYILNFFKKFNYDLIKYDVVSILNFNKKNLERGQWRVLTSKEISFLKMV